MIRPSARSFPPTRSDEQADADRILGRLDAAMHREAPESPRESAEDLPTAILRQLWAELQPAVRRCAKRLGKGEQPSRAANSALHEFRMLAVAVERLNASGADSDDGLDRLLAELPDRIERAERLIADAFTPPLEPP
jgi:hypothetical protein